MHDNDTNLPNINFAPHAEDLMQLLGHPETLETKTLQHICNLIERYGYKRRDRGDVENQLSDSYPTSTVFLTRDEHHKVVELGIGTDGGYWVNILIDNLDTITIPAAFELAPTLQALSADPHVVKGVRFQALLQQILPKRASSIPEVIPPLNLPSDVKKSTESWMEYFGRQLRGFWSNES